MIRWLLALVVLAASPATASDPDYDSFGAYLEEFRQESGTPALSAVIIRDLEIVWEG